MTTLMFLLSIYYTCDAAALENSLTRDEFFRCQTAYDHMKVAFVEGVEPDDLRALSGVERAAVMREGYRRFKAWEAENGETIAALRGARPAGYRYPPVPLMPSLP